MPQVEPAILAQFQAVGGALCKDGLIHSTSGNLSIRKGDRLLITRHASSLGCLGEADLVETGLFQDDAQTPLASFELPVHRAIYQRTPARAVVHAHPPCAVALSLVEREIIPQDTVVLALGRVPVVEWSGEIKPGVLGDAVAQVLNQSPVVVMRGHGSFTTGKSLAEAYQLTLTLEKSSQLICQQRWIKPVEGKK